MKALVLFVKTDITLGVFKAESIDDSAKKLWLIVTESAWLILEQSPSSNDESKGTLRTWASLYGLKGMERNLDVPHNVVFEWHKPDTTEAATFKQEYFVENAEACMHHIASKMAMLGMDVAHAGNHDGASSESDVDIAQLLAEVEDAEITMSKGLELNTLQRLVNLYQKVIEYYSAVGDAKYDTYLQKMKDMMKRGDIQQCMQKGTAVGSM